MNTAYIFGTLGNLAAGSLGSGWSMEETFAWTVGSESELTLPLPGDDLAYLVRCDIDPAVYPDEVHRQRVTVRSGDIILGSFELTGRTAISILLPLELTRGARSIRLTLFHPDAVRPCDYGRGDDSRLLALCFASAALLEAGYGALEADAQAAHGIIAGGITAMRIAEVLGKLPSLRGRLQVRFIDLSLVTTTGLLSPEAMASVQFCWLEINAGTVAERDAFRKRLPAGCTLLTFHAPSLHALWPFGTQDDRAVPEPGRHIPSRYPYGDRHARPLANMNMPDDVVYLMYQMAADQDPIDLDAILAEDLRRCRTYDRKTDMKLADVIESRIRSDRVFMSPNHAGPVLLRAMIDQVAGRLPAEIGVLEAELDFLLDGYAGWRHELPVHKRVAEHFGLAWWSPEFRYCWQNNKRTYREHILDIVRWVQWRP